MIFSYNFLFILILYNYISFKKDISYTKKRKAGQLFTFVIIIIDIV